MSLTAPQMLLGIIYEYTNGSKKKVRFEDIVVKAFEKYPRHFHLKGYPQYPDAGDRVHRELYRLKKDGQVQVKEKFFSLTDRGITYAEKILAFETKTGITDHGQIERDIQNEINRIEASEIVRLFKNGRMEKIFDSDFFSYLGVTVRTDRTDFLARLETMARVAKEAEKYPNHKTIPELHDFLISKFADVIEFKKKPMRKIS